jgi:hypothetical protein
MCKVYAGQNPEGYRSINKSIRIGGHSTSIQLEAVFWELLDEIAHSQNLTTPKFISTLYSALNLRPLFDRSQAEPGRHVFCGHKWFGGHQPFRTAPLTTHPAPSPNWFHLGSTRPVENLADFAQVRQHCQKLF